METYYLVDYESVNNSGIKNITTLTTNEHIHIFYSDDAKNSNFDIMFAKNTDIEAHKVKKIKKGDQSLDKHLVSYLGYYELTEEINHIANKTGVLLQK